MLRIDGSQGEGGGQVLRTSLALSIVTGTPVKVERIRAGRDKPGLLRQHLTAVEAAREVSRARVRGAELRSTELVFEPGEARPGDYRFAVGTAGSATLVLQTVLPALWTASAPSRLVLEGGTHNPKAPPVDFLEKAFLPLLGRMGPRVELRLERAGFFPAGGGRFVAEVTPATRLAPIRLDETAAERTASARVLLAKLPEHVGEREVAALRRLTGWCEDRIALERPSSRGPGNAVLIELRDGDLVEVFTAFGERGHPAEGVAGEAVDAYREHLRHGAPVGVHLADQLLLPLALAGGGGFTTGPLTLHTRTQIEVIRRFLDVRIAVEPDGERTRIAVG